MKQEQRDNLKIVSDREREIEKWRLRTYFAAYVAKNWDGCDFEYSMIVKWIMSTCSTVLNCIMREST